MRIAPGLGRKHFNTLGQQHRGLALYLHTVLKVFNHLHAVCDLNLQQGKRFA
ncbi:hypothetical protein D3C87_1875350 [compost metagenome]